MTSEKELAWMNPDEVVERFVDLAEQCLTALLLDYGGRERDLTHGARLWARDGGRPVKKGKLLNGSHRDSP